MRGEQPDVDPDDAEGDDGGQYADQHRGESDGSEIAW